MFFLSTRLHSVLSVSSVVKDLCVSVSLWWNLCYSRGNLWLKLRSPRNGEKHLMLYCATCAREVDDPLTCGDCSAVICRVCGTPLEIPEDLGIG